MTSRRAILSAAAACTVAPLIFGRKAFWTWPLSHALLLVPTLTRNHDGFGPLVTRFRAKGDTVWLTIDDGPDARDTPGILRVLDRYNAKATFFCVGRRVDAMRDLTREIVAAGHQVENHTYSHPQARFWALTPSLMRNEIVRGADAIESATGRRPALFRSPVGMTNPFVHPVLATEGARLVGWSACGFDGTHRRGEPVVRQILKTTRPGRILLIHEGGADAGRIETLSRLLERLSELGLQCVVPDEGAYS